MVLASSVDNCLLAQDDGARDRGHHPGQFRDFLLLAKGAVLELEAERLQFRAHAEHVDKTGSTGEAKGRAGEVGQDSTALYQCAVA